MTTSARSGNPAKKAAAAADRPSLARKTTKATESAHQKALDAGLAITVDGRRLEVRIRDVRGKHEAQLVAATGMDFMGLMSAWTRRQGLDLMAATIWFARLVNDVDSDESYTDVLDDLGYEALDDLEFDLIEKKKADSPEA